MACAASLKQVGVKATILEKADAVGAVWRRHYDRLHLHTDRGHSGLPGFGMPKAYPRYPARSQMVEYLERYADEFGLRPRFGVNVQCAWRKNVAWRLQTPGGEPDGAERDRGDRLRRLALPSSLAGRGALRWRHPSQQRLSQPGAVRGQARAGGGARQFGRRDCTRSG